MGIELDWQIIDEDESWPEQPSPASELPRPRVFPRLIFALALVPVLGIAVFAAYYAWTYHTQLDRVTEPVQQVGRLELESVAAGDRVSFMALQDPDDPAWRARQERSFGQLARTGLPEFGWEATGAAPHMGRVSLEPGGALLQVTYQFSVTQPMPGKPPTVTLQVPEFYKPTPSGWVRAMPVAGFWGRERTQSGKHITVLYYQRDADIVEPLIPRMDDLVERLCESLTCPFSQTAIVFENSASSGRGFLGGAGLDNSARPGRDFFGGGGPATLRLPSPHLLALSTDTNSRDELYRALETRLARTVVSQALGRNLYMNRLASQGIVQWELARLGLAPLVTEAAQHALATKLEAGVTQPLAAISLRSYSGRMDTAGAPMMSLAFAFLDQTRGTGTMERLIPAMRDSTTLGDAIHTALQVDPETLEPAWQIYLRAAVERQDRPRQGT